MALYLNQTTTIKIIQYGRKKISLSKIQRNKRNTGLMNLRMEFQYWNYLLIIQHHLM